MKKTGIFVTFEGTEGAGKSTLIREVFSQLKLLHPENPILITREPGGTQVAEKIRKLILSNPMNAWTELLLYEAARADHMACKIIPALRENAVVLCDRFTDSTLAYQSFTRGIPWRNVKALNQLATQGTTPDLTILLDIDPAFGLARAKDRNRFEKEGVGFQRRVRQGFMKSVREDPRRWLVLRADSNGPEKMAQIIVKEIGSRFRRRIFHG